MRNHRLAWSCGLIAAALCASSASAENLIRVIYSELPTDPTSLVPGAGGARFTGLLTLNHSPSGNYWIFKGFTDEASTVNDVIVVGSGDVGMTVAKEGDPAPIAGLTYGFMDSDCGVNDSGHYIFGNRLGGGSTADDEVLIVNDGVSTFAAVREGDRAPGLTDPFGAGDELFGNSLNSATILADDTPAFRADIIQNINTDFESALYIGATPAAQEGTAPNGIIFDSFVALAGDTFTTTPDGSSWIVEADIGPGITNTIDAVLVDSVVEIQAGDLIGGSTVDAVFAVNMAGNGDWYARGDYPGDTDWCVRNGMLIAQSGGLVASTAADVFGAVILGVKGNPNGDYLVAGDTQAGDQVLAYNSRNILLRSGDEVDLNGNGVLDDGYFIRTIAPNDLFISDDDKAYATVTLTDISGANLGDALVYIQICIADLTGDGKTDLSDLGVLLGAWQTPGADLTGDGNTDLADLGVLLGNWNCGV